MTHYNVSRSAPGSYLRLAFGADDVRPCPRAAPVTRATLPSTRPICASVLRLRRDSNILEARLWASCPGLDSPTAVRPPRCADARS